MTSSWSYLFCPCFTKMSTAAASTKKPTSLSKSSSGKSAIVDTHKVTKPSLVSTESLANAIARCKEEVAAIVAECRANNRVFRDIDFDLSNNESDCLESLVESWDDAPSPGGALRVRQIFKNPIFCDEGFDAADINQGTTGNCWFLAALASVCGVPRIIENICVARDERVGVYGFIFFKDGDWEHVIVDDQLFVTTTDFDHAFETMIVKDKKTFKDTFRSDSQALFFGKSSSARETWLPLLEKAYTKLHGDYKSVEGGHTGEGIEDLTGGVTTSISITDILDYDRFWYDELSRTNVDSLFSASIFKKHSGMESQSSNGLVHTHAYSVLKAVEVKNVKFLLIRNPWGEHEWNGRWSDGSKEWTPEWMAALDHRFGDDGSFWMQYEDFVEEFTTIERTRLYDNKWFVNQEWMEYRTSWPAEWSNALFQFDLTTDSPANIVLAKADDRYFQGLQGPFFFGLRMAIYRRADDGNRVFVGHFVQRSWGRSISLEFASLKKGHYDVDVMVVRTPNGVDPAVSVIETTGATNPDKLLHICKQFNASRAKAVNVDPSFDILDTARETQLTAYESGVVAKQKALNRQMAAMQQEEADEDAPEDEPAAEDEQVEQVVEEEDEEAKEDKLTGAVVIGVRIYTKDADAIVSANLTQ
ncbi:hypothetical protein H310_00458 [Aphanomyces invadans]|uniref:Calpain catalytic domain-containing protein n=1 Tax=Aphanomyces invadans TaxID=157072 RepID=A0A024UVW5_9STRA|nr:hypothetical protein H310_00458 [Aphanomyces invadans]ETW10072.1 hypothetical protein H310_00458 [Aphanomyces invadans]|eukprot:XP_008861483.1 hypothetical protein H310_00458 [Aphanomyces invadans]